MQKQKDKVFMYFLRMIYKYVSYFYLETKKLYVNTETHSFLRDYKKTDF